MDVNSGRLVTLENDEADILTKKEDGKTLSEREKSLMKERDLESLQRVPPELERAAQTVLQGKREAQVSLRSGGRLSKWAAGQRKKKRRKMAKESRRINRKK